MTRTLIIAALAASFGAAGAGAAEGSCAHSEMRAWLKEERRCYDIYGPLNEQYRLEDLEYQATFEGCLDEAKSRYVESRLVCELRGESDFREDGIHRYWSTYSPVYKREAKRLQSGG